jgi:hypothetical protein
VDEVLMLTFAGSTGSTSIGLRVLKLLACCTWLRP